MFTYGVATISRLLQIIGLFCKISSLIQGSFAKETYNLIDPNDRSHPIAGHDAQMTAVWLECEDVCGSMFECLECVGVCWSVLECVEV